MIGTLGYFMLCVYLGLAILWALLIGLCFLIVGPRTRHLVRYIRDPIILAFSTASSEAALPRTLEALDRFGVPSRVASFVLPLGYSFNLDGSMMYMTFASLFIAQAYGIDIPIGQQIAMVLVLMVSSKGIAGVPRASLVVIAGTLAMFRLPQEGLLLIPRHRPVPRHGPIGDQRRRQCGGEYGGGALGEPSRSHPAARHRAAPRAVRAEESLTLRRRRKGRPCAALPNKAGRAWIRSSQSARCGCSPPSPARAARDFEREAHHHVGGGKFIAGEPVAATELVVEPVEMGAEHLQDRGAFAGGGRADRAGLTMSRPEQRRHQRAFGIMDELAVKEDRVAIGGRAEPAFGFLDQILNDRARFGDHPTVILDHRRLAERVDPLQRRRGEHGLGIALVANDLVRKPEFLEQPKYPLRA